MDASVRRYDFMLEKLITCPLGSECETVKDNKIHQCAWLLEIKGVDPQTGEQVNKKQCAVVAQVLMTMDNTKATFGLSNAHANLSTILLNGKENRPDTRLIDKL